MTLSEFEFFCRNNIVDKKKCGDFTIGKISFPTINNYVLRDEFIYFLWDYSNMPMIKNTRIKIGRSINPLKRCSSIITQSGIEYCKPYIFFKIKDDINAELLIHKCLSKYRGVGEWFNIDPFEAIDILSEIGLINHCFDYYINPKELE